MPAIDKVIVTDKTRLVRKYQISGFAKIETALRQVVATDLQFGLTTAIVFLDDQNAMAAINGRAVTSIGTPLPRQYKDAIDAVHLAHKPDYLVLLGGPEVIPYQRLSNDDLSSADNSITDPDRQIESDLPYACDESFSEIPSHFLTPTRVVGRIPDCSGSLDVSRFVRVLEAIARREPPRPRAVYSNVFAISAAAWEKSTTATLTTVFPTAPKLNLSPHDGPDWSRSQFENPLHYINCHGRDTTLDFLGDNGAGSQPIAHRAARVASDAVPGTVVVAECCYGAKLRDPDTIAFSYLERGAHCVFASTNTSFGVPDSTDWADLLCRSFLTHTLDGRSTGLATLMARLDYAAAQQPALTHLDVKTVAQFVLLGDPSVHAVISSAAPDSQESVTSPVAEARAMRGERRATQSSRALALRRRTILPGKRDDTIDDKLHQAIARLVETLRLSDVNVRRYLCDGSGASTATDSRPTASVLISARRSNGASFFVSADEVNGNLVNVREAHPRLATRQPVVRQS
jgi:hypothetical protein